MLNVDSFIEELHEEDVKRTPEVVSKQKSGWGLFSEEVAWFLYDFFRFKLNGYEKIIFYSYYINGLTLEELGASCNKTHQRMSQEIDKINKKLEKTWRTKKDWKVTDHERTRDIKKGKKLK